MDRIDFESFWLGCPGFADVFVRRETSQCFEATAKIVCADKVVEVRFELLMVVVMVSFDGGILDGPVHSFDLTIGPRVLDLCQSVFNSILVASHVKHMGHVPRSWAIGITRRKGELDAVVRENSVDFVRDGCDKIDEEG